MASTDIGKLLPQLAFLGGLLHGGSEEDRESVRAKVEQAHDALYDAVEQVYVADTIPFPRHDGRQS